jgi:glucosamine-6-phosphate deaminase
MLEGFNYNMAKWIPYQDQEACKCAREIKRENITKHANPDFHITVIRDDEFPFKLVYEVFSQIQRAAEEERQLVLIVPQPEPLYSRVAFLINKYRVNCKKLYTFDMDEYADENGNIAPETWPNSFLYNMKKNFYSKIDPELRPPEEQIMGPSNENFADYGKMIAGLGGADICFGGIGWSGHLAFIEPGSEAYAPLPWDEWKELGPKIVELTPFTVLQGVLGPEFGQSGDWSWYPPKAATIGPKEILSAKLRSSWNGFRVGASMVSWQRFTVRLAAHGPVTPLLPASMLQTCRSDLFLTESLASDITPAADFSWYD